MKKKKIFYLISLIFIIILISIFLNNESFLIDDYNELEQESNEIDFENSLTFKIDNLLSDNEQGNRLIALSKDGKKYDVIFEENMKDYEFESLLHIGDEIIVDGYVDEANLLHILNILKIISVDERKRG